MEQCIYENLSSGSSQLLHYTSLSVLELMLSEHTLLCNSIVHVNDLMEKKRIGIEEFAGTRYISCFCHALYEIVPFWFMYGQCKEEEKVLLRFQEFPKHLQDIIETDYALDGEKKEKIYFLGSKDCLLDDSEKSIHKVELFDVKYRPPKDQVFWKDYCEISDVAIGNEFSVGKNIFSYKKRYDATTLGIYKTHHWKYEEETRLMCTFNLKNKQAHKHVFLRLKDKIFENMVIVANPWADKNFFETLNSLVENANLSENIKNTIKIEKSELHGQIVKQEEYQIRK